MSPNSPYEICCLPKPWSTPVENIFLLSLKPLLISQRLDSDRCILRSSQTEQSFIDPIAVGPNINNQKN